jgi:hypothetical protein
MRKNFVKHCWVITAEPNGIIRRGISEHVGQWLEHKVLCQPEVCTFEPEFGGS